MKITSIVVSKGYIKFQFNKSYNLLVFSGLAVASRYPMKEIEFTMYNVHGPLNDGEKLARKGES